MTNVETESIRPLLWQGHHLKLLDQTRLPADEVWLDIADYRDVVAAIKNMRVRGAPAIGIAGAYAVALAAVEFAGAAGSDFRLALDKAAAEIRSARPTGANLGWAVDRMLSVIAPGVSADDTVTLLEKEALAIHEEDEAANHCIGKLGAALIAGPSAILTHCNAGALATGGYGTALGIVRSAWSEGRLTGVYATETRPLLQGSRLTAWELARDGIPVTLIADSAAGHLMRTGVVKAVIVGADRIAANGDVANKIGTYTHAVVAHENQVPFYVAAPVSTIDLSLSTGDEIVIEHRSPDEVLGASGATTSPQGVEVQNVAFDVTPFRYITAIITDRGVVSSPFGPGLASAVGTAA